MKFRAALVTGLSLISLAVFTARKATAIPAFPGAEGYGASATGGRGGEVFHVVNTLNTNAGTYEGPDGYNRGTLRWCLLNETSTLPRTIVFDVGGQVTLSSQISLEVSNYTIAGQTAPGQGLTTAGRPWFFQSGGNAVIRYVRNRLGRNGGQDSIGVEGGSNIIFDHVTSTWSNDEALSVAKDGTLVTVQNSLIYEGLNHSGHGYGSLIRPSIDSKVSYHHNLYANNKSRNPRPGTYNSRTLDFDFRNNVVYNWGDRAGYSGGSEEDLPEYVNMNYVGNYVIAGPSTQNNWTSAFVTDVNAVMTAHQSGNLIDSDLDALRDGVDTGWGMFEQEAGSLTQRATPHPLALIPVTTQSAADAYESVLKYAGSFWWNRDSHDARIVDQVRTQTGSIIDHEDDVGGFLPPTSVSRDANWDTDHDGMPNHWEASRGLNPNLSSDRNNDYDTDGYTNLEEYLNEAGAWPAPRAITWTGGNGRFALNQNWDTWQPSRFDEVHVSGGTSTVDAIGQQAGRVLVAGHPGDTANLKITGGRLDVAEEIVLGGPSKGVLTLSGGTLSTPLVAKGSAGGSFSFTGGVLHAGVVDFDLVNNGGTLAPGNSLGATSVLGDLTLNSGVLEIEVGGIGDGKHDLLYVGGVANLGGTLRVVPIDLGGGVYVPQLNDQIGFMATAEGTAGAFDNFDLPALAAGLEWKFMPGDVLSYLTVVEAVTLAGDYNDDGTVDAADYTVWRDRLGSSGPLLNETASPGTVDELDYNAWKANFGATGGTGASGRTNNSVPEPAMCALLGIALLAGLVFRQRDRAELQRLA
jgi:pectate lyase